MMMNTQQKEFSGRLRELEGKDFENAVFTALSSTYIDAQPISTRPSGDGGLDVLIEDMTIVHCCYGLEPATVVTQDKRTLRKYVVDKFKDDLKRILELDTIPQKKGKPKLGHKQNDQIADILTTPKKLKAIRCVCNYWEDNKIVGELRKAFEEFKKISKCSYIDPACAVVFWGPDQLASTCIITPSAMLRVAYPKLANVTNVDATQVILPQSQSEFDGKFDDQVRKKPEKAAQINEIRENFREDWNKCLHILKNIEVNFPKVHKDIEDIVKRCAVQAKLDSLTSNDANLQLIFSKYTEILSKSIGERLADQIPQDIISTLAEHLTVRLIGECPIDWR